MPHVKDGSVKAISVWSPKRYPDLPNVPTMIESGYPGLALGFWAGRVGAGRHARRDREAAQRGHQRQPAAPPEMKASLDKLGLEPVIQTPEEFGKFVRDEIPRWAEIVKVSGVKGD